MKNYKDLVPIIMILVYVGSFYMLFDEKKSDNEEYNFYLNTAREYREQDIMVDAKANYNAAYDMEPSLELALEIGSIYMEEETYHNAIDWGEDVLIEEYPTDIEGYEYLENIFYLQEDYISFYEVFDTIEKRQLSSDVVNKMEAEIAYRFFFNGDYEEVGIYSEGLCPVKSGDYWGYVNKNGAKCTDYAYRNAGYFSTSIAPVVDRDKLAYFIDSEGNKKKVVVGVKNVQEIGMVASELLPVYNGSYWGFYNLDNEYVFGKYTETTAMGNGIAAVKIDEEWALINSEGNKITDKNYENIALDEKKVVYRNDRIFVYEDFYFHMIDALGKTIGKGLYQDADVFNDDTYAAVKIDNKWGFIDKSGKVVIEPMYEAARSFSNGYAPVRKAGKWGFIDKSGKVVIDYQFQDAKDFTSKGSVFVKLEDTWQLLRLYKYNY